MPVPFTFKLMFSRALANPINTFISTPSYIELKFGMLTTFVASAFVEYDVPNIKLRIIGDLLPSVNSSLAPVCLEPPSVL